MTPYEIIERKRDGNSLTPEEITYFISSFMNGSIKDYQMSALLMTIYFNGMKYDETKNLTNAYIQSGKTIELSDIPGIKVDKHSTGGVGDKVSIALAPLVASLGIPVPMISGRGLGHTGGTIDKLESIPGFKTNFTIGQFKKLVKEHRLALIGQTDNIVPADKRIYALRDVTATINSIPLIIASIMSKKIAEGIDGLVLDVKCGNGAFMKDQKNAESLAEGLIKIGNEFNKKVTAVITSMDQPLGYKIGNWLEIEECIDCLKGNGPADLLNIIYTLAENMLVIGKVAGNKAEARKKCEMALKNGQAFKKFLEIAKAQGADTKVLETPDRYPTASEKVKLTAGKDGFITSMNALDFGFACVELGAGRLRAEDTVDAQAGIILFKKVGDRISRGEDLLEIRTNKVETIPKVLKKLQQAITIGKKPPKETKLIIKEFFKELERH
jgi:pyrimidine-nucleoside phosphorylase